MKKIAFALVALLVASQFANAQDDLMKIIPPSPTVASLGAYGDTKVGYYTGTPSISVPIHNISAGDLSLPISLSYSAKGIKVEEIASWVGLGWSLNAGGIITRSVRGGPDEYGNGYMSPTVKKVNMMRANFWPTDNWYSIPGMDLDYWPAQFNYDMQDIAKGLIDAEADIFYYNFAGQSGKFYYNQDKGTFISIPQSALFFDKAYFTANNAWRIVAENGIEYFFELPEKNLNYSQCDGSPSTPQSITTGWFLTQIHSPATGQEIDFTYDPASYSHQNIASYTLNVSPAGDISACVKPTKVCYSVSNYSGYRLSSIQFDAGHIDFKAFTDRCDLPGDKRLDYIEMYNTGESTPYRKFQLGYSYYNNNLPCSEETAINKRLKLTSFSTIDANGVSLPAHTFDYDESIAMPSRMSYSQDAWGYFNNKTNAHLVPPFMNGGLYLPGANRTVDTTYTGVGMLKKITYPTGGTTEFQFENNKITDYIKYSTNKYLMNRSEILDATNDCNGTNPAPVFCKTVVINDQRQGGAYINVRINNMACWNCNQTPPPVPTTCAQLTLGGMQLVCSQDNVFVPNGTYTLSADFSGSNNPSNYQDFSIQLFWEEYNPPAGTHEASIGGLRVKKITNNDGLGNTSTKEFQYEGGCLSDNKFIYEYQMACGSRVFYVRSSYSNITLGAASGSTFGYGKVTERQTGITNNGKSVYYFSTACTYQDQPYYNFPYGDPISFDHRRGLLLKKEDYRWTGSDYQIIKSVENQYKPLDIVFDWQDLNLINADPLYDETFNIRAAYLDIVVGNGLTPFAYPVLYKTVSEWIREIKTTERQYDYSGNYSETVSSNVFNNYAHQQATETHVTRSNGAEVITRYRYPLDYAADQPTNGIKGLQDNHYITTLVEKVTSEKDALGVERVTGGVLHSYDGEHMPYQSYRLSVNKPIPLQNFVFSGFANGSFQNDPNYLRAITFRFDHTQKGKLISQQKEYDFTTSYLWGYNSTLPIAEVQNAVSFSIFHTSFEDDGVAGTAVTGKKYYSGSSYTIPTVNRPVGSNLKMTYWYNDGSWKLRSEVNYSPTISEANATAYDEVRVYPAGSLMTTYTHTPGFGITTSNDPNNKITFFEYDSFGRLVKVSDDQKQILKTYTYHLKNQTQQ